MLRKTCNHCGKEFDTFPSLNRQYCSKQCSNEGRKKRIEFICATCGKQSWYHVGRPKKYCSISCGITARNLTEQNPSYHRDISGEKNPMYGKGLVGEENPMYGKRLDKAPRWKGGRKIRKDGYILVVAPLDHPYPTYTKASGLKYILEHRYVMEKHLGRYLDPEEVVHHIDENPQNNAINNLRLYSSQAEHIRDAHGSHERSAA